MANPQIHAHVVAFLQNCNIPGVASGADLTTSVQSYANGMLILTRRVNELDDIVVKRDATINQLQIERDGLVVAHDAAVVARQQLQVERDGLQVQLTAALGQPNNQQLVAMLQAELAAERTTNRTLRTVLLMLVLPAGGRAVGNPNPEVAQLLQALVNHNFVVPQNPAPGCGGAGNVAPGGDDAGNVALGGGGAGNVDPGVIT